MEHLGDETLSRIKELGRCEFEVSKAWYLKGFSNTSEAAETRCMATLLRVLGEAGGNLGRGGNVKSRKNAQEASNQHSDLFHSYITNVFSEGINSKNQAISQCPRLQKLQKIPHPDSLLPWQTFPCSIKIYERSIILTISVASLIYVRLGINYLKNSVTVL